MLSGIGSNPKDTTLMVAYQNERSEKALRRLMCENPLGL